MNDDLRRALNSLTNAHDFMAKCKANMEEAVPVGAYKDALDWIEDASLKVVTAWKQTEDYVYYLREGL